MSHRICRITSFEIVGPYTVRVDFDDDTKQVVDLTPVLRGELLGPLRDRSLFEAVRLDEEAHTLVWPNGADLDPATLHDWPAEAGALCALAGSWADVVPSARTG